MTWLILHCVKFEGPKNKQTSRIIKSRVNMDMVISYFEAPEALKNHKSEDAQINTLLVFETSGENVFSIKETVEEIDNMLNLISPKPVAEIEIVSGWKDTRSGWTK